MQLDPVEDVDQGAQELPGGHADPPAEGPGDGIGEVSDEAVVGESEDPVTGGGAGDVEIQDLEPDLDEPVPGEALQADLREAGVVPPGVAGEVDPQAGIQRREAANALVALEEGGGAGDEQVQAGVVAGVNLVDPLA